RTAKCPNSPSTTGSDPEACTGRSTSRRSAVFQRLAGDDIAPASVMRRAPSDSDVTRPLRLSIILIYRKPLSRLTYRVQLRNKCFVGPVGSANGALSGFFEAASLQWLAPVLIHGFGGVEFFLGFFWCVVGLEALAMPSSELTMAAGFCCCSAISEARLS